jgi:hypothetical protein
LMESSMNVERENSHYKGRVDLMVG